MAGGCPYSEDYKYMGGTSMSNPLAAGGAAVVRDYYQKAHALSASAALVKATLINSAVDLLDENNDGVNDNDYPIPNVHEGWGLVNLANATDNSHQFVEEAAGVKHRQHGRIQLRRQQRRLLQSQPGVERLSLNGSGQRQSRQ